MMMVMMNYKTISKAHIPLQGRLDKNASHHRMSEIWFLEVVCFYILPVLVSKAGSYT